MVKDVILECLMLMDNISLYEKIKNINVKSNLEIELQTLEEADKNTILILVSSLKNVINSITRNYLKNYAIERVMSDDEGRIPYSNLTRPIISVKSVTDEINSQIVYKAYFDFLKVPFKNKLFDVCYSFETSDFVSLFDKLELPLGLSCYTLALGTVASFMQIKLLYNEAEIFESKFRTELSEIKPNSGVRSFFVWRN